ncbi:MAG: hypothetical protein LBI95_01445 [Holosporales bacterium]|nr:hypothetical protein [Holosporales bacterium]
MVYGLSRLGHAGVMLCFTPLGWFKLLNECSTWNIYVCDESENLSSKVKQNLGRLSIIKLYLYTFKTTPLN